MGGVRILRIFLRILRICYTQKGGCVQEGGVSVHKRGFTYFLRIFLRILHIMHILRILHILHILPILYILYILQILHILFPLPIYPF